MSEEALVTVVRVFVTSRIDYCKSLLYGIYEHNTDCLPRVATRGFIGLDDMSEILDQTITSTDLFYFTVKFTLSVIVISFAEKRP